MVSFGLSTSPFNLKERYGGAVYPSIELVNMFDNKEGINTIFSNQLIESINNCLLKNEQIILLHNRRGYATILFCSEQKIHSPSTRRFSARVSNQRESAASSSERSVALHLASRVLPTSSISTSP